MLQQRTNEDGNEGKDPQRQLANIFEEDGVGLFDDEQVLKDAAAEDAAEGKAARTWTAGSVLGLVNAFAPIWGKTAFKQQTVQLLFQVTMDRFVKQDPSAAGNVFWIKRLKANDFKAVQGKWDDMRKKHEQGHKAMCERRAPPKRQGKL